MPDAHQSPCETGQSTRCSQSTDALTEVLRLVREMSQKIDAQDKEITEIRLRLERGASSIEASERNGDDLRLFRDKLLILETRFAILWAGLGVAGAAGITGLVSGIIALMRSHP